MKLSSILEKENNNLDLFRLIAACAVIYGHAYAIAPQVGHIDFVARMFGHDYSGSLAVKAFFFLSGLVVTNSLIQKKRAFEFVIARFFRIFPGLIFVVLFSSFVLGPLLTNLPLGDYLSNPQVYNYALNNLHLKVTYSLPGVFLDTPRADVVNGSLWTLPLEVGAYLVLLLLFIIGVFRSKIIVILIFSLLLIDPVVGNKVLFTWRSAGNSEVDLLAPCFAMGSILSLYKEKIDISGAMSFGLLILYLLLRSSPYNYYFFYVFIFYFMVYISSRRFMLKLKLKSDVSYGVYLWGFPIQQTVVSFLPDSGILFNQVISTILAILIANISWHLVEKRGILFGRYVVNKLYGRGAITVI